MKHPLFKKWLRALRSGDFKQVKNQLYAGHIGLDACCAFGCLGRNISSMSLPDLDDIIFSLQMEGLPVCFEEKLVLGVDVIQLNDFDELSFPEIADELEKAYYEWRKDETPTVQELVAGTA